jgi:nitroreductase
MIYKEADNKYPINGFSKARWSPRAFSDRPVEKEKLQSIFEAARWSPSSGNQQPWKYIVGIKPDETWKNIFECLDEGNRLWGYLPPVLMITCGRIMTESGSRENSTFRYDTGQSAAHLSFEATGQGLFVHQMAGFNPDKAIELFGIPQGYLPLTVIAVGYMGEPELLKGKNYEREFETRTRKDCKEFVFSGRFGEPLQIF